MTNFNVKTGKSIYEEIKLNLVAIDDHSTTKHLLEGLPTVLKMADDAIREHRKILKELKETAYTDKNNAPYNGWIIFSKINELNIETLELKSALKRLDEANEYRGRDGIRIALTEKERELKKLHQKEFTVRPW